MTLTIEARLVAGAVTFLLLWYPCLYAGDDWPQWRGTNRDGRALDEVVPVNWSETKNIIWKAAVPGRGQSDPTVVGPSVFLTTADEQQQSLLCFDRKTGEQSWQAIVHKGGFDSEKHEKCSLAAPTVACDGERVFVAFLNRAAIYVTAFSMGGQQLWQQKVSDFNSKFGYGASPLLYKSYVIVASDNQGGGAVNCAGSRIRQHRVEYTAAGDAVVLVASGRIGRGKTAVVSVWSRSHYQLRTGHGKATLVLQGRFRPDSQHDGVRRRSGVRSRWIPDKGNTLHSCRRLIRSRLAGEGADFERAVHAGACRTSLSCDR